jgi:hypothetical protein
MALSSGSVASSDVTHQRSGSTTSEGHFRALKQATLTNTDDPEHVVRSRRIYRYLRYRTGESGRSIISNSHPLSCLIKLDWQ